MTKNAWLNNLQDHVQPFIDSLGDGVLIMDNKGLVTTVNDATCQILGYKNKKDLVGQEALSLFSATNESGRVIDKRSAALFKSVYYGKKIIDAKRQFVKKDGRRFWSSITTTPMKDHGKITGAILVFRDITEAKQQEEYRTDFAHVASHNLRSPMGNLLWATEYILSEKPGKLNKKQKEYITESYETLQSMNRLVNDLLSISRIQNKRLKMKKQKVSISQTIQEVTKNLSHYAQAENVTFDIKQPGKSELLVHADPEQLNYIIQNVIENAIRYSFDHSVIKIRLKKENGSHLVFSCTNKGIGIDPDKKQFIFAKFFRAQNAINKQGDGTGLGLYVTHEFVRLNRGKIWFESTPNQETTFFVRFKT